MRAHTPTLPLSLVNLLAWQFLDFAPSTRAAPQPERLSDLVPIADASTYRGWPKRSEEQNLAFRRRREGRED
ncbi:hypothetical protein EDD85DRAFT_870741 [Armillaria nabsnona]|nr:hypothetical protein EDD85DRAFT_870741 [Armillaria nabsnona]